MDWGQESQAARLVAPEAGSPGEDADSFVAWVRPHWLAMVRLAQRMVAADDADDVVQEALSAAWRSRHRFDSARGEARAWLLAIVANQARDQRTASRRAATVPVEAEATCGDERSGTAVDVGAAVARLAERQRLAVALFYYLGLPVAECAAVMGCSVGTVKSTLADARERLRRLLGEDYR